MAVQVREEQAYGLQGSWSEKWAALDWRFMLV
jgi:hypothetical protein